jgi:hypothetical protein
MDGALMGFGKGKSPVLTIVDEPQLSYQSGVGANSVMYLVIPSTFTSHLPR